MRLSMLVMGAAMTLCAGVGLANAQDPAPPQAAIDVRGLDLTQPSGQTEAENRLQTSATAACRSGGRGVQSATAEQSCETDLLQKGRSQLADLTAQQTAAKQATQQGAYAAGYDAGASRRHVRVHHVMRHRRRHRMHHHVAHHTDTAPAPQ